MARPMHPDGRLGYDWQTGAILHAVPGRPNLAPIRLPRWTHTCPDGTRVSVSTQFIRFTGATLYRWCAGGVRWTTVAVGDTTGVSPDWTAVDLQHAAAA